MSEQHLVQLYLWQPTDDLLKKIKPPHKLNINVKKNVSKNEFEIVFFFACGMVNLSIRMKEVKPDKCPKAVAHVLQEKKNAHSPNDTLRCGVYV